MRKYRAVIFDLWGTLVDELSYPEENRRLYLQNTHEMADLLGLDPDGFSSAWSQRALQRIAGDFSSTGEALSDICRALGIDPVETRIQACTSIRFEYVRNALNPRHGTIETLCELREKGFGVGLISNCGDEVSQLWDSTQFAKLFDVSVLSFQVGLTKPDVRIYELAAQRLRVPPDQCLYVGDGSDGELSGASRAGMTAVLIRTPYDLADGSREQWPGDRVENVGDVLNLL